MTEVSRFSSIEKYGWKFAYRGLLWVDKSGNNYTSSCPPLTASASQLFIFGGEGGTYWYCIQSLLTIKSRQFCVLWSGNWWVQRNCFCHFFQSVFLVLKSQQYCILQPQFDGIQATSEILIGFLGITWFTWLFSGTGSTAVMMGLYSPPQIKNLCEYRNGPFGVLKSRFFGEWQRQRPREKNVHSQYI